jgi:hypothetical protein
VIFAAAGEKNGNYSSRERMDYIRKTYFNNSTTSFGKRKMPLAVQSDALCINSDNVQVACSENRRWEVNGVTYFTLNIPGEPLATCKNSVVPA